MLAVSFPLPKFRFLLFTLMFPLKSELALTDKPLLKCAGIFSTSDPFRPENLLAGTEYPLSAAEFLLFPNDACAPPKSSPGWVRVWTLNIIIPRKIRLIILITPLKIILFFSGDGLLYGKSFPEGECSHFLRR